MTNREYLSCAETAKLLRQALKESFPGTKFSVRSSVYSGGASIDVKWTDGPTSSQVKPILDTFNGAYFDGMIDYKGSRYHALDGKPCRFGADFIFGNRALTKARAEAIAAHFAAEWGRSDWLEVTGSDYFGYRVGRTFVAPALGDQVDDFDKATNGVTVQPSPTRARVSFLGDDGYGQGTVGNLENGYQGDQCAKAVAAAQQEARLDACYDHQNSWDRPDAGVRS